MNLYRKYVVPFQRTVQCKGILYEISHDSKRFQIAEVNKSGIFGEEDDNLYLSG
jgi:hypothetical protein